MFARLSVQKKNSVKQREKPDAFFVVGGWVLQGRRQAVKRRLGMFEMSVEKLNSQSAHPSHGAAFDALAELCRIVLGVSFRLVPLSVPTLPIHMDEKSPLSGLIEAPQMDLAPIRKLSPAEFAVFPSGVRHRGNQEARVLRHQRGLVL